MDELLRHLRSRFLVADVATWDKFTSKDPIHTPTVILELNISLIPHMSLDCMQLPGKNTETQQRKALGPSCYEATVLITASPSL